jgi:hypothetical protein
VKAAPELEREPDIIAGNSMHPTQVDTPMILFLASEESRHVTRLELRVDAGFSIK